MRRDDANIGDVIEVRFDGRWHKALIEQIKLGQIYARGPREIHALPYKPKDCRIPKTNRQLALEKKPRSVVRNLQREPTPGEPITCTTKRGRSLGPMFKDPGPWRSEPYKALVRKQPCVFKSSSCYGAIEAHHHGKHPVGQKTDDSRCVPLCVGHHRDVTDTGWVVAPSNELAEYVGKYANEGSLRRMTSARIAEVSVDILAAWLRGER